MTSLGSHTEQTEYFKYVENKYGRIIKGNCSNHIVLQYHNQNNDHQSIAL